MIFIFFICSGVLAQTPEQIVKEIYSYEIEQAKELPTSIQLQIEANEVELNDKEPKEIFARLLHPAFCGTGGCSTYILVKENNNWREISPNFVTHGNLEITSEKVNGFYSIKFGEIKTWKYNGSKYQ